MFYKSCTLVVAALLLASSAVAAPQVADGQWLCVEEFGGGITFNTATGRWEGTTFKPVGKFVVKATYVRSDMGEYFNTDSYNLVITDFDLSSPYECLADDGGAATTMAERAQFTCTSILTRYTLNLQNGRFVKYYAGAYASGQDEGADTPYVMGGTCARF